MNMKRMASLCIVMIVILLTAVTPGFAESALTSDIGDEYIKAAVERLNALGIIDGMDDGKYHPEAPVTREQLAKILVVTLGLEDNLPTQAGTSFKDVDAERWSAGYIGAAAEQGLIQGYPDGTFQPEKRVSYAEALTMLIRCLGYADQDLQGPWPENYLTQAEVLNITDNLTFSPAESADRGAVAVMTNHTLDAPVREQDSSSEVKTLLSLRQGEDEEESGQEQDALELTLEDAIEAALQDNPTIEQAQLALEDSKVKYERGEFSIKKVEDSIKDIYGKHSLTYLEQITKNELINELSWEIAQREYQDTIDTQKAEIEKMYFSVVHAQKNAEIYEENVNVSKALYENTQKRFALGLVTQKDVASAELNYEKARKDLTDIGQKLKTAKMNLNIMLGYGVTDEVILADNPDHKPLPEVDMAEVLKHAQENRTDLVKAQLAHEVAKIEMDITAKKYPPLVYEYRTKEVALKQAEQALENAAKMVEMDVRNKYSTVLNKKEAIRIGEKSVGLAQKVVDLTTISHDAGVAVLTDVQQAQIAFKAEQLMLAQNILDYNLAVLGFEKSLGNELGMAK